MSRDTGDLLNTNTASSFYFRRLGQEAARELKLGADDFARLSAILDARSACKPNSNVIQFQTKARIIPVARPSRYATEMISRNSARNSETIIAFPLVNRCLLRSSNREQAIGLPTRKTGAWSKLI